MSDESRAAEKRALRRRMLDRLGALSPEEIARCSARIRRLILGSRQWSRPGAVLLLFAAMPAEPDLVPLLAGATDEEMDASPPGASRVLVFPRVTRTRTGEPRLALHRAASIGQFRIHARLGIREPDPTICPEVRPELVTAAFVPGLAFDPRSGVRLGRGGGYYDRLLALPGFRAERIGLGFAMQRVADLPCEPHDRPMDAIVTEDGFVEIGPRSPAGDAGDASEGAR